MSNENKPTPHQHANLIHAWAEGVKIQSRVLLDYDNVEQWSKWTDDDEPEWWNEDYQFRIKPEKLNNKPWTPEFGVEYYYVHVDSYGRVFPRSYLWTGNEIDHRFWEFGNCFRTIKEAKAAIPRVKDALKGCFAKDVNIPINVGSPEIDGATLTGGEVALIKALRKAGRIGEIFEFEKTLLVSKNNYGKMGSFDGHIAFIMERGGARSKAIVKALKQIKTEQKENNDFN